MPKQSINCAQIGTSSTLSIEALSDLSQVLITLRRNENLWLSPSGWSGSEKGTLLDCQLKSERTLVDIPAEFSAQIQEGDSLHITCESLGVDCSVVWSAPKLAVNAAEETTSAPAMAASALSAGKGLLARFKGDAEVEAPQADMSDVERQAKAAQKAASDMRAKMENAHAAKEAAHQRALEAARLAEEARKTEEAQIAQMEAVERNLREAEAARREELAKIEEERREEEARRVEAARLAEEARQLEEMRRQKAALAERKATLTQDLDIEVEARITAQKQADKLSDAMASQAVRVQTQSLQIADAEQLASKVEKKLSKTETALLNAKSSLETLTVDHQRDNQALDTLASDMTRAEKLRGEAEVELANAETGLQQAKARVQAATMHAEKVDQDIAALSQSEHTLREQTATRSVAVTEAEAMAGKALAKFEGAQSEHAQSKQAQELLKSKAKTLQKEQATLGLKASQAKDELDVITKREATMRDVIAMIDNGKPLSEVDTALSAMPGLYKAPIEEAAANDTPGLLGGFKRKIAASRFGAAAPTLYADVETTKAAAPFVSEKDKIDPVANNDSQDLRRALVASVAAIAFVGVVGYGASKLTPATASAPKPVDSISAENTKLPEPTFDLETLKVPEVAPTAVEPVILDTPNKEALSVEPVDTPKMIAAHKAAHAIEKPADSVSSPAAAVEERAKKPVAAKPATMAPVIEAKVVPLSTPKPERPALVITKPKPTKKIASKSELNPEQPVVSSRERLEEIAKLKTVQSELQTLGFYDGEIDGLPGGNTDAAIIEFKTLFGLSKDEDVSPEFVKALNTANDQVKQAKLAPPKPVVIPQTIAEPAPEPTTVPTPQTVEPTPKPIQSASIVPVAKPMPAPADVIVDAKRLKALSATYPNKALRRNFYRTVSVELTYDIDALGNVVSAQATSISDDAGRYEEAFAEAGLKAVKKQRFTPKTINGIAVESTNHTTKILFRTE